jgi:hypothetical protein
MSSHICGRVLAIASAALLSACKTFSPDGGMGTVPNIAGQGLNKDVVRVSSSADAAYAQNRVARLLRAPLSADAAVQVALLTNASRFVPTGWNLCGEHDPRHAQLWAELDRLTPISVNAVRSFASSACRARLGFISIRPSQLTASFLALPRPPGNGPEEARKCATNWLCC